MVARRAGSMSGELGQAHEALDRGDPEEAFLWLDEEVARAAEAGDANRLRRVAEEADLFADAAPHLAARARALQRRATKLAQEPPRQEVSPEQLSLEAEQPVEAPEPVPEPAPVAAVEDEPAEKLPPPAVGAWEVEDGPDPFGPAVERPWGLIEEIVEATPPVTDVAEESRLIPDEDEAGGEELVVPEPVTVTSEAEAAADDLVADLAPAAAPRRRRWWGGTDVAVPVHVPAEPRTEQEEPELAVEEPEPEPELPVTVVEAPAADLEPAPEPVAEPSKRRSLFRRGVRPSPAAEEPEEDWYESETSQADAGLAAYLAVASEHFDSVAAERQAKMESADEESG